MANAALVTFAELGHPNGRDHTQRCTIIRGRFTLVAQGGGQDYPFGGLPFVFTGLQDIDGDIPPFQVRVWSDNPIDAGNPGSFAGPDGLYIYVYNSKTQKLQIFVSGVSGNPLNEFPGGALPGTVMSDEIRVEAFWAKGFGPQTAYPF